MQRKAIQRKAKARRGGAGEILKVKKKMYLFLSIIIFLMVFSYTENNYLQTTRIRIKTEKLPSAFNGFKIIHLSDLHGKTFGKDQEYLVKKVKKENPDVIVYTGDLVNKRNYNEAPGLLLLKRLKGIAPVYFVSGNHEWWTGNYESLRKHLREAGVIVLENSFLEVKRDKDSILICGMEDPAITTEEFMEEKFADRALSRIMDDISESNDQSNEKYKVLLSHRPELFQIYKKCGFDIIFSGHAHGGQVRLPFIGAIVSPNQGLFPTYSAGLYEDGGTNMVVSRGLGNSIIPQRIFNRPEVVAVTLVNK